MKICHVSDGHPDTHTHWGGAELACKRSIALCDERHIEQFLITTSKEKDASISTKHFEIKGIESFFGTKLRGFIGGLKTIMFPFDPFIYYKCLEIFKKNRPSVVHLHNFKVLTFAIVAAANKLNIPTIFSIYDYWIFCPRDNLFTHKFRRCEGSGSIKCLLCYRPKDKRPNILTKLPLLFRKQIFNYFLNKITAFIALSNASKNLMTLYGISEKRTTVIRQYYDISTFKISDIEKEPDSVLYTAWISPNKGAHAFVEAAGIVIKTHPNAKFYLAGEARNMEYLSMVKKRVKDLNLENNCFFLGKKTHAEVSLLLQKCEIVVVPEQWENMAPIFLTEAMSWGKPIVAGKMGGMKEVIHHKTNGLLAWPYAPEEYAENICWYLDNKAEALKMGNLAQKDSKELFGTSRIWDDTVGLYKDTKLFSR